MTPAEIVQCEKERTANERKEHKHESENQQAVKNIFPPKKEKLAPSSRTEGIRLKGCVMLATKSDLAEIVDTDMPYYALICKDALFSLDDVSSSFPSAVINLL